jgi:hypothetical protein
MKQFQCPNCGGYRTLVERPGAALNDVMSKVVPAVFILLAIAVFYYGFKSVMSAISGFLGVAVFLAVLYWVAGKIRPRDPSWKFGCQICGFKWSWLPKTPYPYRYQ